MNTIENNRNHIFIKAFLELQSSDQNNQTFITVKILQIEVILASAHVLIFGTLSWQSVSVILSQ